MHNLFQKTRAERAGDTYSAAQIQVDKISKPIAIDNTLVQNNGDCGISNVEPEKQFSYHIKDEDINLPKMEDVQTSFNDSL